MLEVVFHRIAEGEVDRLRWWMGELHRRRDEVLETFENEGTRHEIACLVHTSDGPILVYAIERTIQRLPGRHFALPPSRSTFSTVK